MFVSWIMRFIWVRLHGGTAMPIAVYGCFYGASMVDADDRSSINFLCSTLGMNISLRISESGRRSATTPWTRDTGSYSIAAIAMISSLPFRPL